MTLRATEMGQAMVDQLGEAWQQVKGEPMPASDLKDAQIMFLAVARGLLVYLEAHQNDMVNSIQFSGAGSPSNVISVDISTLVEEV